MKKIYALISAIVLWPSFASAHEAYVLNKTVFWSELAKPFSLEAFDALKSSHNLHVTLAITRGILALLAANFLWRISPLGKSFEKKVEKLSPYGPLFVRAAISAAFFFSAYSESFLGPELPLSSMPYAHILQWVLYVASVLIALGFFTELAGIASLVVFTVGFHYFGMYLLTYLNYLGEIIVLALFGSRKWSVDGMVFGHKKLFSSIKKYDTTIIRICYGLALMYAALTVKFLHPELTMKVVKDWNLTQFHWLFPHDPLLVTLGAGLAELAIGLFILIGFEMRLTILISLFYITLSLMFFRELVWPHLMLYGISFNLLVQPEIFTIDHLLFDKSKISFWKRPFLPHSEHGRE